MKGSGITGPVAKEAADLWPKIASSDVVLLDRIWIQREDTRMVIGGLGFPLFSLWSRRPRSDPMRTTTTSP